MNRDCQPDVESNKACDYVPRPNAHTGLDSHNAQLVHQRVRLSNHPEDFIPATLDRSPCRVHRACEPGGLEEFLDLGDLLGYRELARADLSFVSARNLTTRRELTGTRQKSA